MPRRNSLPSGLGVACLLIVLSSIQSAGNIQASASPHRGGHARHAAHAPRAQPRADEESMDQSEQQPDDQSEVQRSEGRQRSSGSDGEVSAEERRSSDGTPTEGNESGSTGRTSAEHTPPTLLSLLLNLIGMGMLVVLIGMIPTCGTAVICAIVYHASNALRGGKRPSVG